MSKQVISIDCGGTNLRVAVVDEGMNILAVRRIPTIRNNPDLLYSKMVELIEEVRKEAGLEKVEAIGMSLCGVVTANKVGRCGNLGFDSYDFESLFHRDYPEAKLLFANDANCSALVEAMYGANVGLKDSAFITISTGIGLGVIHKGEMIDLPLEGGRLMIEYEGKIYESEALLSGQGIVNLCKLHGVNVEDTKQFFDAVRAKCPPILKIYDVWIKKLGLWLANLQLLFNVDRYAFSGGVMKSSDVFLEDLVSVANAAIAPWHLKEIVVVDAKFSQDVGICAGAALGFHALEK